MILVIRGPGAGSHLLIQKKENTFAHFMVVQSGGLLTLVLHTPPCYPKRLTLDDTQVELGNPRF